jgi:hypothetical protein
MTTSTSTPTKPIDVKRLRAVLPVRLYKRLAQWAIEDD